MKKLVAISKSEILDKVFEIYGDFENPLFLAKFVEHLTESVINH